MTAPLPWRIRTASCGAYPPSGVAGKPQQCDAPVTHAGLILRQHPLEAHLAFACDQHASELRAPRPLLDRDRAVLADWRAREADVLAGRGWRPPEPLAVGAEARELVRRAEAAAGQGTAAAGPPSETPA